MPQFVRFLRFGEFSEDGVDLDVCRRFSIGPPIQSKVLPFDWNQVHVYYLTPDSRWICEGPMPGMFAEIPRDAVRDYAIRVHFPLPPELETQEDRDAYAELRTWADGLLGQPKGTKPRQHQPDLQRRQRRLVFASSDQTISLDGQVVTITNPRTFRIICYVAQARGQIVPSEEIREKVPGCKHVKRIDIALSRGLKRFKESAPWVCDLVTGTKGHGGGFTVRDPK